MRARTRSLRAGGRGYGTTRGQVLVLACVTFLLLALGMLMSFQVSNAVHEKIRLQQSADAAAFSVATVEARGLNVIAYQNRAFVATTVTMMTLHGWMALSAASVRIGKALHDSFEQIRREYAARCNPLAVPRPRSCHDHCDHRDWAKDVRDSIRSLLVHPSFTGALHGYDRTFNLRMRDLSAALRDIERGQRTVLQNAIGAIDTGGALLSRLKAINGADVHYVNLAPANRGEFACAPTNTYPTVPGMPSCARLGGPAGAGSSPDLHLRSGMARSGANAARSQFEGDCGNREGNRNGWLPYTNPTTMPSTPPAAVPTEHRRCARALNLALQPAQTVPTNALRTLLRVTGHAANGLVNFRVPLYVTAGDRRDFDDTDTSEFARISAVGDQNKDRQPSENSVVITFHREYSDWTAAADPDPASPFSTRSISMGSQPHVGAPGSHRVGQSYSMASGDVGAQEGWAHLPCAPGTLMAPFTPLDCEQEMLRAAGDPGDPTIPLPSAHAPGIGHAPSDTNFNGICRPGAQNVCYVAFRSDPRPETDYGQPSVYQAVRRQLSPTFKPWELDSDGRIRTEFVRGQPQTIVMKPRYGGRGGPDMAYAVSKAKVYYHELSNSYSQELDYKRPPNLFDPFWRAKLHPFRYAEKRALLTLAGDTAHGVRVLDGVRINVRSAAYGERE